MDYCLDKSKDFELIKLRDEYLSFIDMKFSSKDLQEYNIYLSKFKYLYDQRKESKLFALFERIQLQIFLLLENVGYRSIVSLIEKYIVSFKSSCSYGNEEKIMNENLNYSNVNISQKSTKDSSYINSKISDLRDGNRSFINNSYSTNKISIFPNSLNSDFSGKVNLSSSNINTSYINNNSTNNLNDDNDDGITLEGLGLQKDELSPISKIFDNFLINKLEVEQNVPKLENLLEKILCLLLDDFNDNYEHYLNSKNPKNKGSRILIFVENRIVADAIDNHINEYLSLFLNIDDQKVKKLFSSVRVVGVSKKKVADNSIEIKNNQTEMNDKLEQFRKGEAKILVATSSVEEGLDVSSCNVVIVFTNIRTPKSYVQMKGRARRENAKLLIYTQNRVKSIENIRDFANLIIFMRQEFQDKISKDFRNKDIEKVIRAEVEFIDKYKFEINESESKLTIKNVAVVFNELSNQFKSKKIKFTADTKTTSKKEVNGQYQLAFISTLEIKSTDPKYKKISRTYESFKCFDKDTSRNHAYLLFIQDLYYEHKMLDKYLKLIAN